MNKNKQTPTFVIHGATGAGKNSTIADLLQSLQSKDKFVIVTDKPAILVLPNGH